MYRFCKILVQNKAKVFCFASNIVIKIKIDIIRYERRMFMEEKEEIILSEEQEKEFNGGKGKEDE